VKESVLKRESARSELKTLRVRLLGEKPSSEDVVSQLGDLMRNSAVKIKA
jgi:hypothetical protein